MQLRPTLYLPVAATTSNRVRQMDRRNDTAPLNRKCDHCLRSPLWTHACALCLILIYFSPLFYAVGVSDNCLTSVSDGDYCIRPNILSINCFVCSMRGAVSDLVALYVQL